MYDRAVHLKETKFKGYPCLWVDINKDNFEFKKVASPTPFYGGYIMKEALKTVTEKMENYLEVPETSGGEFYLLNQSVYKPGEEQDNPIFKTEFVANYDFKFFCVIQRGSKSKFWMYSKLYSEHQGDLGAEEYVSASKMKKRGKLQFVRNQELKPNPYCVFKSFDNETTIISFFS